MIEANGCDYLDTIERLRVSTESHYMALESALVPSIVDGFAMQPIDRINIMGEMTKVCSSEYLFEDRNSMIKGSEFVFECNMIKFKRDKCKRLIYDRVVHILSEPNQTISDILSMISEYDDTVTYDSFIKLNPSMKEYTETDIIEVGVDINTGIQSNLYNLHKLGYVFPFLAFLNDRAIPWDKTIISVDTIDVFIILDLSEMKDITVGSDDRKNATFKYLDLPFQIDYIKAGDKIYEEDESGNKIYKYPESYLNKTPIFYFSRVNGGIYDDNNYKALMDGYDWFSNNNGFERIFTNDNHIIYEEFALDTNSYADGTTSKLGTLLNKKFNDFDYRFKIKKFNILCFEYSDDMGYELRQDFDVVSHPFNILQFHLGKLNNNKRIFKIFYNTRIMYDQDNVLRIKNKDYLESKFDEYMKAVSLNVKVFVEEVYKLMIKDIGVYLDASGNEYTYNIDERMFVGTNGYKIPIDLNKSKSNTIAPDEVYGLVQKYPDEEYDNLKLRTEIVHFNNMEEGSTPADEFIYYYNEEECKIYLNELIKQIFDEDSELVKKTMNDIVSRAHVNRYRAIDPATGLSYKNEWFLRKNLHEMFMINYGDSLVTNKMDTLFEVFDFAYKDTYSYSNNVNNAIQYIIGYDVDKLEAAINRSVMSTTRTGAEVKSRIREVEVMKDEEVIVTNKLVMSRWGLNKSNNFVMIFRNGLLYDKYNTLYYEGCEFFVDMDPSEINDDDKFEFVFFLNATNEVVETEYKEITIPYSYDSLNSGNSETSTFKGIACNTTTIAPEDLMVLTDIIDYGYYNDSIDFSQNTTAYKLDYCIAYYQNTLKTEIIDGNMVTYTSSQLVYDDITNGTYNVTKQGGGEYFIELTSDSESDIELPQNIMLCSKRQFRYTRHIVEADSDFLKVELPKEFKYCMNENQFMVFKNYRLLPPNSVYAHSIDYTPLDKPILYLSIEKVKAGDVIDVFYVSNKLTRLSESNTTQNTDVGINTNMVSYKKLKSDNYFGFALTYYDEKSYRYLPTYGHTSRHSLFVFLNGKKIPIDEMEDISNTIIKITTDQTSNDRLEIYSHVDISLDEKNRVYIDNDNSLSMEYDLSNRVSNLDESINFTSVTPDNMNKLFDNYATSNNTDKGIDLNYMTRSQIIGILFEDYIEASNGSQWWLEYI